MKVSQFSVSDVTNSVSSDDLWRSALLDPAQDVLSRPKKDFRSDLVRIGFDIFCRQQTPTPTQAEALDRLAEMLEWIHTGSLIIDDIQDDSSVRRGAVALHKIYGVPTALNVGNWMYFESLSRIHDLDLGDSLKLKILGLTHRVMSLAHRGQALDLAANMLKIPRISIPSITSKSHEMKSGALVALSLQLGALVANPEVNLHVLENLGVKLGVSLQRFDDLGNLKFGSEDPKALEDLRLGRPSWVWMYLALQENVDDFDDFREAVRALPQQSHLEELTHKIELKPRAYAEALRLHREIELDLFESLHHEGSSRALLQLKQMTEKIAHAYQ